MGTGGACIESVVIEGRSLGRAPFVSGATVSFVAEIRFDEDVEAPVFGFALKTVEDVLLYCLTSNMVGEAMPAGRKGETRRLRVECPLRLPAGAFFADFSIGASTLGELRILDARVSALRLDVHGAPPFIGLIDLGGSIAEA
jgi:hypothetical protein